MQGDAPAPKDGAVSILDHPSYMAYVKVRFPVAGLSMALAFDITMHAMYLKQCVSMSVHISLRLCSDLT